MVQVTYPGVYIDEPSSGVRTVTGVATSIAAFVGYTARGPDHKARRLHSFGDFERIFGGLHAESELSYAILHFFANGGTDAYVVRVPRGDAAKASVTLLDQAAANGKKSFVAVAVSTGQWGNRIVLDVDYDDIDADPKAFNLTVTDMATGVSEYFPKVSTDAGKSRYVTRVVNDEDSGSTLIEILAGDVGASRPPPTGTVSGEIDLSVLKNDKAYALKVSSDLPATGELKDVDVTVFQANGPLPTSAAALARLLERQINAAFDTALKGAAKVRCDLAGSGKRIRLYVESLNDASTDALLSFAAGAPNSALAMLKLGGNAVSVNASRIPLGQGRNANNNTAIATSGAKKGTDGTVLPMTADLIGNEAAFEGIYALAKVDLFNLLCIPDATRAKASDPTALDEDAGNTPLDPNAIYDAAHKLCADRRAFLLIDPPPHVNDAEKAADWKMSELSVHGRNGAAFFSRLRLPDPLNKFQLRTFAPCGVVAGLYARTDATRGVWKAPAGTDAALGGVQGQVYSLTDLEQGTLNPLGLNCFRKLPVFGHVAWGARTLVGADADASEWKYVPVRRTALFIEESLYRGTQWVVFEPNDEPLWAQIRLNIGAFMHSLFVQGAFAGKTPRDAYLVKCDRETTTQDDVNRGIVNILVGFAPLKPAEFVIIRFQQLAGQIQT